MNFKRLSITHSIISIGLLLLLTQSPLISQGFLRASGQRIVNNNGEFQLRGIGLGGWLLPEGYMLQTSSFANAAWEFRKKIEDLVGTTNADEFFSVYRANFVRRVDVDQIAAWGFNSIRLPMHYGLMTPKDQPGVYLESGFAIIDSLLAWCEVNHIYLILDLHAAPGGQSANNICDYNPAEASLWDNAANRQRTVDLWKKLATRYASKQWIGGYDLLNETAWNLGSGNVPLRTLLVDITTAIRTVDTNHIIFMEGNSYATDFNGLTPPWDNNMAYSFHKYWNPNDIGSINYLLNLRSTYNVPLWLGESGENSNTWFTDAINMMEANHIGWAWWTLKKIESVNSMMSVTKTAEYNYLLQYWTGKAAKPSVSYAVTALNTLAQKLLYENCRPNNDVIDAMFRQPFTTLTIPFAQHSLPGIVYASDYDLGQYNVAYHDADVQNTGSGANWNLGWSYRNDGVDIEECSDLPTNGYDIGWTGTGDYLNFTVNVAETGSYDITARVSGGASGGKILLKWDGQILGSLADVPYSGGYQNWQDVPVGNAQLTAGTHTLGIYLYFGGFNVNYVEFVKKPTGVDESHGRPATFVLYQNFPNPFNPTTTVRFDLAHSGPVSLRVLDMLGRTVATLVDGELESGEHTATFDASALASGLYVYQLRSGTSILSKKLTVMK